MNRAIFLDRDGIMNEDRFGYPHKVGEIVIAQNAAEGMKVLSSLGHKKIIISNQSGVGIGKYAKEDFYEFTNALLEKIGKVDDVFACFHAKEDKCECRKPSPKMILDAAKKHDVSLENSFVIGDQDRDIEMGRAAGCKTIFISSGAYGTETSKGKNADYIAKDLLDAAKWIVENEAENKGRN